MIEQDAGLLPVVVGPAFVLRLKAISGKDITVLEWACSDNPPRM
jgi:hypothetical protein